MFAELRDLLVGCVGKLVLGKRCLEIWKRNSVFNCYLSNGVLASIACHQELELKTQESAGTICAGLYQQSVHITRVFTKFETVLYGVILQ